MRLLEKIKACAQQYPDREAVRVRDSFLTYRELWQYSDSLAEALDQICGTNHEPVAVYGHKNPYMLVCFLACVKSKRAYCPIDRSVPVKRVEAILDRLSSPVVLATEEMEAAAAGKKVAAMEELMILAQGQRTYPERRMDGEEIFYIIFTSGSTGNPKGVQITANALDAFLEWAVTLGTGAEEKRGAVFLNQAPFSFDLSVMDVYTSLYSEGTLYCLEKETQMDYKRLMEELGRSHASVWVSTPSFADICLSEPSFDETLMPSLRVFLFCGETLQNRTVKRLRKRFKEAVIVNTYGPTESTVAVTETVVTDEMADASEALPVGRQKKGTMLEIQDEAGRWLPEGEAGEIVILGDTVSAGYYKEEEKSRKVFFTRESAGKKIRGYRTGDKGYLKNGMLYYLGRLDLQIKLHGYRMELEDIERNLMRLPFVERAAVIPKERKGQITSLTAFVSVRKKQDMDQMKEALRAFLPDYMIPKKIVETDYIPVTANGKTDRKALKEWEA